MARWLADLGGLVVGLLLAEAGARLALDHTPLARDLAFRFGPVSNELAWWVSFRSTAASVPRQLHDPVLGWRPAPGAHPTTGVVEGARADGTRVTGPRGAGPKVLLVGDSFTYGVDVGDEDTWAWALQAAHPDWAVVDAGLPGGSLTQAWLAQRVHGPADVVVLGLNTLLVEREQESFATYRRPQPPGPGCEAPPSVPTMEDHARAVGRRSKLWDLGRLLAWRLDPPTLLTAWPVAEHTLDCLVADVQVPLVVAWLPIRADLTRADDHLPRQVVAWRDAHPGVGWVDATPAVRAVEAAGEDPWRMAHWSAASHRAVAGVLGPAVERALPAPSDLIAPAP